MTEPREFFGAIARRYDRVYALSGETSRARLKRVIELLTGKRRVLVLGVGTGRELPALLDAGHEATGVEIAPEMIALCNKRTRTIPIVEADLWETLPFPDASFDAAIALHGTLAHPPRGDSFPALAKEIARVLVDGGVLVAEVPSLAGLARLSPGEGMTLARTGETSFVHTDEIAGVAIEGVAYDADGWRAAFAPHLGALTESLGEAEYLVVASPSRNP